MLLRRLLGYWRSVIGYRVKSPEEKRITEYLRFSKSELTPEVLEEMDHDTDCIVIKDGMSALQLAPVELMESPEIVQVRREWVWCKSGWPKDIYEDRTNLSKAASS